MRGAHTIIGPTRRNFVPSPPKKKFMQDLPLNFLTWASKVIPYNTKNKWYQKPGGGPPPPKSPRGWHVPATPQRYNLCNQTIVLTLRRELESAADIILNNLGKAAGEHTNNVFYKAFLGAELFYEYVCP